MLAYLAIYDPSQPAADGTYWHHRSPRLRTQVLDRFYYDVATGNRPDPLSPLSARELLAGVAPLEGGSVAVYRYFDGGHDARGRPGRFVLAVAVFLEMPLAAIGLESLLFEGVFGEIARLAPSHCPLPRPSALEVPAPVLADAPASSATADQFISPLGARATWSQVAAVLSELSSTRGWVCYLRSTSDGLWMNVRPPKPAPGPAVAERPSLPVIAPQTPVLPRRGLPPRFTGLKTVAALLALLIVTLILVVRSWQVAKPPVPTNPPATTKPAGQPSPKPPQKTPPSDGEKPAGEAPKPLPVENAPADPSPGPPLPPSPDPSKESTANKTPRD